jgi:hypothetical protein
MKPSEASTDGRKAAGLHIVSVEPSEALLKGKKQ